MIGERIAFRSIGDPALEPGLAARQLVADEQLLDDPVHLRLVQEMEAAPPFLELEEALARFSGAAKTS